MRVNEYVETADNNRFKDHVKFVDDSDKFNT